MSLSMVEVKLRWVGISQIRERLRGHGRNLGRLGRCGDLDASRPMPCRHRRGMASGLAPAGRLRPLRHVAPGHRSDPCHARGKMPRPSGPQGRGQARGVHRIRRAEASGSEAHALQGGWFDAEPAGANWPRGTRCGGRGGRLLSARQSCVQNLLQNWIRVAVVRPVGNAQR
jgi:hypothetical protein